MSNIDLLKTLKKVEAEADIQNLFRYEDTNSWIHVKFSIYLFCLKRNKNLKASSRNIAFHYLNILSRSLMLLFNRRNRKVKNLFFGSSRGLHVHEGMISDFFFPHNMVSLEDTKLFMNLNDFEEYNKYKDYLRINNVIFDNLFHPLIRVYSLFLPGSKSNFSVFSELLSRYGIPLSNMDIRKMHLEFVSRYIFFRSLLKRFKLASNAYVVSCYSKSYITAALQHHNIPCFEIQHGHIGRTHVGYHYEKPDGLPIPDGIFVYDDFWATEIKKSNFTKVIRIYEKPQYKAIRNITGIASDKYILFTGQGINVDQVNAFINESAAYLKDNKITLIYKPHPSEHKGSGAVIKESCLQNEYLIYYEGEQSTEQLIVESCAHISISSFCHFDAIHFKGKTYVLESEGSENIFDVFIDEYKDKFVKVTKIEEVYARR